MLTYEKWDNWYVNYGVKMKRIISILLAKIISLVIFLINSKHKGN